MKDFLTENTLFILSLILLAGLIYGASQLQSAHDTEHAARSADSASGDGKTPPAFVDPFALKVAPAATSTPVSVVKKTSPAAATPAPATRHRIRRSEEYDD